MPISDNHNGRLGPRHALLAIEKLEAEVRSLRAQHNEPLAIIGVGCRFPGGADHASSYWQALERGVDAIGSYPRDRFEEGAEIEGLVGGFLPGIDGFDAGFFEISPREAALLDPQQRLALEVAWEALEDAGRRLETLRGSKAGVYVGLYSDDYAWLSADGPADAHATAGAGAGLAANRISYFLDLNGPSISLDTTCSSSLTAVHLACQGLRQRETDLALAGGVSLILSQRVAAAVEALVPMAADRRCKPFDARADGIVRGEGCGFVVLKRLTDALRDGDAVRAIIRGTALNHDGRSNGLTAPNPRAQVGVIQAALLNAGLSPEEVGYVECHGTGTSLGDPIELEALQEAYDPARRRALVVGSVKSNLGHLEAAAGIAGLIKATLSVENGAIPASLHFENRNPNADPRAAVGVCSERREWSDPLRRAGVSAFSIGGSNAHVLIENIVDNQAAPPAPDAADRAGETVLLLSARDDSALAGQARQMIAFLRGAAAADLPRIARSAALSRTAFEKRLVVFASSCTEAAERLDAFLHKRPDPNVLRGNNGRLRDSMTFVYSGQGSHWAGMGLSLLESEPTFRERFDRCADIVGQLTGLSLRGEIEAPDPTRLDDPAIGQPAVLAIQIALTHLLRDWGFECDAVIGHSAGEIAAAYAAGVYSLEDAVRLGTLRAQLLSEADKHGAMLAVRLDEAAARAAAHEFGVSFAACNAPAWCALSGGREEIAATAAALSRRGIDHRRVRSTCAFHSDRIEAAAGPLEELGATLQRRPSGRLWVSSLSAAPIPDEMRLAGYWARAAREPVRFNAALERLLREGCRCFVEVAPHPALSLHVAEAMGERDGRVFSTLRRGEPERKSLLRAAAQAFVAGAGLHWDRILPPARPIRLPHYAWNKTRYRLPREAAGGSPTPAPGEFYELRWELDGRPSEAQADYLPQPQQSLLPMRSKLDAISASSRLDQLREGELRLNALCTASLALALSQALGAWPLGARLEGAALSSLTAHPRYLQRCLELLSEDGWISAAPSDAWIIERRPDEAEIEAESRRLGRDFPACRLELALLERWRRSAGAVLQGKCQALEALFPEGSLDQARALFRETPFALGLNALLRSWFEDALAALPAGRSIRVLEVGAGTGGATAAILDLFDAERTEYVFSDVSSSFLKAARHEFAGRAPFLRFERLDVEHIDDRDRERLGRFDVILAANVLHATQDVRSALGELRRLLVPGGALVLLEATAPLRLVDLTFGMTPEWWSFTDVDERPSHPLLSVARWTRLLGACGLEGAAAMPPENDQHAWWRAALIVAKNTAAAPAADCPGSWLILADEPDFAAALGRQIEKRGGRPLIVEMGGDAAASSEKDAGDPLEQLLRRLPSPQPDLRKAVLCRTREDSDRTMPESELQACLGAAALVRWLETAGLGDRQRLWIATRGCQAPPDSKAPQPGGASLWGLATGAAAEHPELAGGIVDLDPEDSDADSAGFLLEETLAQRADAVARRAGLRWVSRLVPRPPLERKRFAVRERALYLITGGFGGMGLLAARRLVERGARRLVLVGRSGAATPQARQALSELRRLGAEVEERRLDVADPAAVDELFGWIRRQPQPLRGVLHAAGVFDDRLLLRHAAGPFRRVFAPKVAGAWNLHRALGDSELDFFVLFSSAAGLLRLPGVANYAAANAFLDGLARHRRARGKAACSIAWAGWTGTGMASAVDDRSTAKWAARGLSSLAASEGVAVLEAASRCSEAQVIPLSVDWARFLGTFTPGRTPAFFSRLRRAEPSEAESADRSWSQELQAAAPEQREALLFTAIDQEVQSVLELPPNQPPDRDRPLAELGLDSLLALELRNRLCELTGLHLPATLCFDCPSIEDLVDSLASRLGPGGAADDLIDTTNASSGLGELFAEIDQLSDNDVDAELLREARSLLEP